MLIMRIRYKHSPAQILRQAQDERGGKFAPHNGSPFGLPYKFFFFGQKAAAEPPLLSVILMCAQSMHKAPPQTDLLTNITNQL